MSNGENAETETFTDEQATDEAMLLLTRKMRRLFPAEFATVWAKLPEGAHRAIYAAERRADRVRDAGRKQFAVELDEDE